MSTPNPTPEAARPPVDFTQEIRFAIVMYGGSSLAIYINGVAQELLRLVRATAPEIGTDDEVGERAYFADGDLKGSERVYRRIGQMLRRGEPVALDGDDAAADADRPIQTRFIVDILTGTSAGGINAVYLAKALANDQSMDELKKLWVTEGDIGALINDDLSYVGLEMEKIKDEPFSLLNSRRMYLKLLEALRGMDKKPACEPGSSPLVDDLDLYVTSTDIAGRIVQMSLADEVVTERRHRNVFHFRYRSGRTGGNDPDESDFGPEYNAFLAFAARATSAHQAAFAPVNLEDVTPIAGELSPHRNKIEYLPEDPRLRAFYRDYLLLRAGEEGAPSVVNADELAQAFRAVWFNDGGTLDNKPFSFVFEELPLRMAGASVDRKLIYVEPSPEDLRFARAAAKRPRIVQNAWGGLSTLPSYETIVEDLQRVLERNRLIERVRHITADFEDDIKSNPNALGEPRSREEMRAVTVQQLIAEKGAAWGGYQRLRIAQATDDLTLLVTRAAGIDEDSDEYTAVRQLVRYWRKINYDDHPDDKNAKSISGSDKKQTEMSFLLDYDLQWTIRRVRFVLRKLDELSCFDEHAQKLMSLATNDAVKWPAGDALSAEDAKRKDELKDALRNMRGELGKVLAKLNAAARSFWAYREDYKPNARKSESEEEKNSASTDGGAASSVRVSGDDGAQRAQARDEVGESGDALVAQGDGKLPYLNPFRDSVDDLGVTSGMLIEFLKEKTDKDREATLTKRLAEPSRGKRGETRLAAFNRLVGEVSKKFVEEINAARKKCYDELLHEYKGSEWNAAQTVSHILHFYFRHFEDFDQITFPIFYSTDVGEELDTIEVFRVSPEDARAIVDEKKDTVVEKNSDGECEQKPVLKLAGTTLSHFGAFFERKFRINDIMWGRLDGAERIIAALLPTQDELRRKLTREAHLAIIAEEAKNKITLAGEQAREVFGRLSPAERGAPRNAALSKQVDEAVSLMLVGDDCGSVLREIASGASRLDKNSRWRVFLEAFVAEFESFSSKYVVPVSEGKERLEAFRDWFFAQYKQGRQFSPDATVETAERAQRVLIGMVEQYFPQEKLSLLQKLTQWKKLLPLWFGRRVQIFTEAAIHKDTPEYRKLRNRLIVFYVFSVALLMFAAWLAYSRTWVGLAVTIMVAVAAVPLLLTALYHFAWRKFKGKVKSFLPQR